MTQKQNRLYPLDRIRNISAGRLGTEPSVLHANGAPLIYFFVELNSK